MRILLWHVHGAYTTALVQGGHDYLVPVTADRDADGRGRADTHLWPDSAVEVPAGELRDREIDVVVLQRPRDLRLCWEWTGRRPGVDLPAVYLEHNTPGGGAVTTRHPMADQHAVPIVHVTHFNRLVWDNGDARTVVVEHGIIDPGYRYTGELPRAGVVVNEPVRRGRAVGTDLLGSLASSAPLDVFGMATDRLHAELRLPDERLRTFPDLSQDAMHAALARRRVYVHTHRWTSLGLSLLEAMHLGLPVVVLGTTEAAAAVPQEAGCVSVRPDQLAATAARLLADPARRPGRGPRRTDGRALPVRARPVPARLGRRPARRRVLAPTNTTPGRPRELVEVNRALCWLARLSGTLSVRRDNLDVCSKKW